ncbi:GNAT family N-acetyltransferase [Enterococcus crotali]|uniref:GNAT family N-acetyltransferase n=1 Tax=Enterococcus crotali TaxID=1453587 RepID=UPI000471E732|nr:GNAT family N-acetyltransferase [Enterococcus crotali]
MKKLTIIDTDIKELLSQATTSSKVVSELENYLNVSNRVLYLNYHNDVLVGCIGIKILKNNVIEITHLATKEAYRCKQIGSRMIAYIEKTYEPFELVAETDNDAVGFYKKYGFEIDSLGEKYPGVERFNCLKSCFCPPL